MKTGPMLRCESSPSSAALRLESISAVTPHKVWLATQFRRAPIREGESRFSSLGADATGSYGEREGVPRLYILSSVAIQPGDIIHFEYRATPAEREGTTRVWLAGWPESGRRLCP